MAVALEQPRLDVRREHRVDEGLGAGDARLPGHRLGHVAPAGAVGRQPGRPVQQQRRAGSAPPGRRRARGTTRADAADGTGSGSCSGRSTVYDSPAHSAWKIVGLLAAGGADPQGGGHAVAVEVGRPGRDRRTAAPWPRGSRRTAGSAAAWSRADSSSRIASSSSRCVCEAQLHLAQRQERRQQAVADGDGRAVAAREHLEDVDGERVGVADAGRRLDQQVGAVEGPGAAQFGHRQADALLGRCRRRRRRRRRARATASGSWPVTSRMPSAVLTEPTKRAPSRPSSVTADRRARAAGDLGGSVGGVAKPGSRSRLSAARPPMARRPATRAGGATPPSDPGARRGPGPRW